MRKETDPLMQRIALVFIGLATFTALPAAPVTSPQEFEIVLRRGDILRLLAVDRSGDRLQADSIYLRVRDIWPARQEVQWDLYSASGPSNGRNSWRVQHQAVLADQPQHFSAGWPEKRPQPYRLRIVRVGDAAFQARLQILEPAIDARQLRLDVFTGRAAKQWEVRKTEIIPLPGETKEQDEVVYAGTTPGIVMPAIRPQIPRYPDWAREQEIQGDVNLNVTFKADGTYGGFELVSPLGFGLDEEAIETIANRWTFTPGRLDGKPVSIKALVTVSFSLH